MAPQRTLLVAPTLAAVLAGLLVVLALPAQAIYPSNPVQTSLRAAGDGPVDIALSADDSVYVLSQFGSIVVFGATLDDSRTYTAGSSATAIAVNANDPGDPRDDSVYVTSSIANTLIVYSNGMDDSRTVGFAPGVGPGSIAVDQTDDTVYVATWTAPARIIALSGANLDDSQVYPLEGRAQSIAVDSGDDTVYIANGLYGDPAGLTYSGPLFDDSVVMPVPLAGSKPWNVAVSPTDDSVYVGLAPSGGATPSRVLTSAGNFDDSHVLVVSSTLTFNALAVTVARDGSTVYAVQADGASGPLYVLRAATLDDSTTVSLPSPGSNNFPQTVVASGSTAYTANNGGDSMSVVQNAPAPIITTINPASGLPAGGNTVTITGAGFVNLVSTVKLGGIVVPGAQVTSPTTMTFTAPAHVVGSADVTVTTGLLSATVVDGYTWSNPGPTPPVPVFAPGQPRDVTASAGDQSGRISWVAPASTGSYPITSYRATVTPSGRTCVVPATELSCEISGLTNGTEYSVVVQALNGVGWSEASTPPAVLTPRGAVIIVGARDGRRLTISGQAPGWTGATVIPRFKFAGQKRYSTGTAEPTVRSDGSFTWSRQGARKAYVYVTVSDVRSNRVIIAAAS